MIRSAIVDTSQSPALVVNVIDYASDLNGKIPPGMAPPFIVVTGNASIGWVFVNGALRPAQSPVPPVAPIETDMDIVYAAMVKFLLSLENRIRALENKPAITKQQFLTAVKAL